VLGGCGSAIFAATFAADAGINIGLVGVSLAFGLTVLTMAYAVGHVSGGHFNPAVSIGLFVGGRFGFGHLIPYILFQVLGAIAAAFVLQWFINEGSGSGSLNAGAVPTLASNGYDAGSPGGFSMMAVIVMEVIMTAFFLIIIMGSTDDRAPAGFAPIAIGSSVNPARSTGPALVSKFFGSGESLPLEQLHIFWAAPIVGAVIGALIYRLIVSGAAPAESADRVEYREPEYRDRAPADREYIDRDYRDRGEYRDYREDYRDDRY